MTIKELIQIIERPQYLMIAVSTGGILIDEINDEYQAAYQIVDTELRIRGLENPNPYSNLLEWYGKWSAGDLPSYQSRHRFLSEMFNPLIRELENRAVDSSPNSK
ncbi:hypothetical protein BMS3Abin06_02583 [bacterium BMS3Abin06]|nr:hypothetical protein BMS3Abin06_02583 [bacterium BMS3Abin06]HDZ01832.1 hypothetical protein [Nitrospirota bacterium]